MNDPLEALGLLTEEELDRIDPDTATCRRRPALRGDPKQGCPMAQAANGGITRRFPGAEEVLAELGRYGSRGDSAFEGGIFCLTGFMDPWDRGNISRDDLRKRIVEIKASRQ